MGWFSKARKTAGWMATSFQGEGVCVAIVSRPSTGLPKVEAVGFSKGKQSQWPELLQKIAKDYQAGGYQCTTLLAPSEYQLLSVDAPNVPPEELKTAIRWRLKDMLDYHVDDATIDVLDVPVDKNGGSRTHSMYAVAARNQLIEQRQTLFTDAKIPLTVIDIPDMAQRNISALLEPEGRGLAMLSFSSEGGLLTVTYQGEIYLSRRIDISLDQLAQGDADQRRGLHDRITLELQRSLDHFDRQYHFVNVPKLLMAPMGEAGAGLREYLSTNLYIEVDALNLEQVLDLSAVPDLKFLESQQRFFMTLGAALRHEEKAL